MDIYLFQGTFLTNTIVQVAYDKTKIFHMASNSCMHPCSPVVVTCERQKLPFHAKCYS